MKAIITLLTVALALGCSGGPELSKRSKLQQEFIQTQLAKLPSDAPDGIRYGDPGAPDYPKPGRTVEEVRAALQLPRDQRPEWWFTEPVGGYWKIEDGEVKDLELLVPGLKFRSDRDKAILDSEKGGEPDFLGEVRGPNENVMRASRQAILKEAAARPKSSWDWRLSSFRSHLVAEPSGPVQKDYPNPPRGQAGFVSRGFGIRADSDGDQCHIKFYSEAGEYRNGYEPHCLYPHRLYCVEFQIAPGADYDSRYGFLYEIDNIFYESNEYEGIPGRGTCFVERPYSGAIDERSGCYSDGDVRFMGTRPGDWHPELLESNAFTSPCAVTQSEYIMDRRAAGPDDDKVVGAGYMMGAPMIALSEYFMPPPYDIGELRQLDAAASHELGHSIGLGHHPEVHYGLNHSTMIAAAEEPGNLVTGGYHDGEYEIIARFLQQGRQAVSYDLGPTPAGFHYNW